MQLNCKDFSSFSRVKIKIPVPISISNFKRPLFGLIKMNNWVSFLMVLSGTGMKALQNMVF